RTDRNYPGARRRALAAVLVGGPNPHGVRTGADKDMRHLNARRDSRDRLLRGAVAPVDDEGKRRGLIDRGRITCGERKQPRLAPDAGSRSGDPGGRRQVVHRDDGGVIGEAVILVEDAAVDRVTAVVVEGERRRGSTA